MKKTIDEKMNLEWRIREGQWDMIDYDTVFQELDQMKCVASKKVELYKLLYRELQKCEQKTIWKWIDGTLCSWKAIVIYFPVGGVLASVVLGRIWPMIFFVGIPVTIIFTIINIAEKIIGIKAKKRMDHLKEKGFDLYLREIPVLWEDPEE